MRGLRDRIKTREEVFSSRGIAAEGRKLADELAATDVTVAAGQKKYREIRERAAFLREERRKLDELKDAGRAKLSPERSVFLDQLVTDNKITDDQRDSYLVHLGRSDYFRARMKYEGAEQGAINAVIALMGAENVSREKKARKEAEPVIKAYRRFKGLYSRARSGLEIGDGKLLLFGKGLERMEKERTPDELEFLEYAAGKDIDGVTLADDELKTYIEIQGRKLPRPDPTVVGEQEIVAKVEGLLAKWRENLEKQKPFQFAGLGLLDSRVLERLATLSTSGQITRAQEQNYIASLGQYGTTGPRNDSWEKEAFGKVVNLL